MKIVRFIFSFFCAFGLFLGLLVVNSAMAESITLTTYYPSPVGEYDQLRTNELTVNNNLNVGGNVTAGGVSANDVSGTKVDGTTQLCVGGDCISDWSELPAYMNSPLSGVDCAVILGFCSGTLYLDDVGPNPAGDSSWIFNGNCMVANPTCATPVPVAKTCYRNMTDQTLDCP